MQEIIFNNMSSLDFLRGEREIKVRGNSDRRMLSTKISELNEQTSLNVVEAITFQCLNKRTRLFAKKINHKVNAQELIDVC